MKLFACMCNQPQRLWAALAPVRPALIAQPPVSRWGLAYSQGGDVLLIRTPKGSAKPVDLAAPLAEIHTDCAIGQAASSLPGEQWIGTEDTPPFRYRRWMFAHTGVVELDPEVPLFQDLIPEFLRRNIRGHTPGERVFHVFLAMLHNTGAIDDPNVPVATTRRALAKTIDLVAAQQSKSETAEPSQLPGRVGLGTLVASNGRSMVAVRLGAPLRVRRLRIDGDPSEARGSGSPHDFRGVLMVSGEDGNASDGFEDVPANRAVVIHRNLQFEVADLHA